MRRQLFPCALLVASMAGWLACDPDLTPETRAVPEGPDSGKANPTPTDDGGSTPDTDGGGGDDASSSDAADDSSAGTTHKIDGTNDFTPQEKFVTSSIGNGYEGFVSWDSKNLYFGMSGADIGKAASEKKWVLVYIEGSSGTTTGVNYDDSGSAMTPQQPTLPFSARYHLGFKTDLSYTNKLQWDSGQSKWVDAGIALLPQAALGGTFMEMSIPRSAIGNPTTVKVHMSMLIEQSGSEWSYAAVPSTSFTDGPDPNYTKSFAFDLNDTSKAPNSYTPQ